MLYDYMRPRSLNFSGMEKSYMDPAFGEPMKSFTDFNFGGGGYGGYPMPSQPPMTAPTQPPMQVPQSQLGQMYQGAQLQPQTNTRMMGIWRR